MSLQNRRLSILKRIGVISLFITALSIVFLILEVVHNYHVIRARMSDLDLLWF